MPSYGRVLQSQNGLLGCRLCLLRSSSPLSPIPRQQWTGSSAQNPQHTRHAVRLAAQAVLKVSVSADLNYKPCSEWQVTWNSIFRRKKGLASPSCSLLCLPKPKKLLLSCSCTIILNVCQLAKLSDMFTSKTLEMRTSRCLKTNQSAKILRLCDWPIEELIHFQINQNRCQRYLTMSRRAVTSSPSSLRKRRSTISSVTLSRATWGQTAPSVEFQTSKSRVENRRLSTVTWRKHTATRVAGQCRQLLEIRRCRRSSCQWRIRAARKRAVTHLTLRCLTQRRSSSHNWTN